MVYIYMMPNSNQFSETAIDRLIRGERERSSFLDAATGRLGTNSELLAAAAGRSKYLSIAETASKADAFVKANGGLEQIAQEARRLQSLVDMAGGGRFANRASTASEGQLAFELAYKPFAADWARTINGIGEQIAALNEGIMSPFRALSASSKVEMAQLSSAIAKATAPLRAQTEMISQSIAAINKPLVRISDEQQSFAAIGRLTAIGQSLGNIPPFEKQFGEQLRAAFGDWRGVTLPSDDVLVDLSQRGAFYRDTGYDPELVDFPEEAFDEVLDITKIGPVAESEDDEQLAVEIYLALRKVERLLRQLIVQVLQSLEGDDWARRSLPNGMRDEWVRKQEDARKRGEPEADLIHYADFTDYRRLVEKRDLWRSGFSAVFSRKEDVLESLTRLSAVRIPDMHGRVLTQDDLLLVRVEGNRILRAIQRNAN